MINEELQTIEFESKDGGYRIDDDRMQALIDGYSSKLDLKCELLRASAWLKKNRSRQRQNKLVFRFVDAEYSPDYFFNENDEAIKIKEVIAGFEKRGIFISQQIDTFERYRNILYGTETDKLLSKNFLAKVRSNCWLNGTLF